MRASSQSQLKRMLAQGGVKPWEITQGSKYRAKRVTIDGINFPSKVQSRYYLHLKQLQAAGEIEYFLRDVRFDVLGKRAEIDFMVVGWWTQRAEVGYRRKQTRYIDVKGSTNANVMRNFRRNKKQIETGYPVTIEVVREIKGRWVYSED